MIRVRGETPGPVGVRRQPLLQPIAVHAEFEGDPAKSLIGFQQQPIDGFAQGRSRATRPLLSPRNAITDDAQFVAV